jgi:hypothetical protein
MTILSVFEEEKEPGEIFSYSLFVPDRSISAPSSLSLSVLFQLQHGRNVKSVKIL